MKVAGFAGFFGSGKTTLIEQLIPALRRQGLRVSVVKHAHHRFDIDHPGKDTYRHREAGAFEVVAASDRRPSPTRALAQATPPNPQPLPPHHRGKRAAPGHTPDPGRPPGVDGGVAVATKAAHRLPVPTTLPVLDLDAP